MLASDAALVFVLFEPFWGEEVEDWGDDDDMAATATATATAAAGRPFPRHTRMLSGSRQRAVAVIRTFDEASARAWNQWACRDAVQEQSVDVQMRRKCSANQRRGGSWGGEKGRTICYWEPSVLFLDLEFVAETLGLCILSVPVHVLVVVRRLRWFHTVLLWRGGRHVYSAGCRGGFRLRGCVCAGQRLSDLLASTSLGDYRQAV
jgi:hypothetical protein